MLANIRNNTKGPVAYLIVGLITVPFALFGINQFFTGETNITVAKVGDSEIKGVEYAQNYNRQKRILQEQLGDDYNAKIDANLKSRTINGLIDRKILETLASDLGLVTSAEEIKADILSDVNFYQDGVFNIEQYQNILRLNGYTTEEYENLLLKQKTITQLRDDLLQSSFLTKYQENILNNLINQQRNIAYIVLDKSNAKVKVSDSEIENYFTKNSANFQNDKQVSVDFIELNLDNLAKDVVVDDAKLQTFYNEIKDRYTTDETRKASHILIEDKDKAQDILTQIKNGADFAKLAKANSIDSGSGTAGGDLGYFGKGVMVKPFEDKVFSMQVGEVSDLIKSDFGYHIIKLVDVKPSKAKPFASVKAEIIKEYKKSEAQQKLFELSETVQTLAYDGSLEDAADELNLKVQTTDLFTPQSTDFDKKFIDASFSGAVLSKDENYVIESTDKIVVMRKNKFIDASSQTLEQATTKIKEILLTAKIKQYNINQAKNIVKQKNGDFSAATWIDRVNDELDPSIVNFAFTLSQKSLPNYQFKEAGDKVIIVKLNEVKTTDEANNLEQLNASFNQEIFNDILKNIKSKTDIKIFNKYL